MAFASFDQIVHQFVESLKKEVDESIIKSPGSMPAKSMHMADPIMGKVNISIYFSRVVQMYGALRQGEDILDTHDVDIVCVIDCPNHNVCISRSTRPLDIWRRWPEMTEALIMHTAAILEKERAGRI